MKTSLIFAFAATALLLTVPRWARAATPCCEAAGGFACNDTATPTDPNGCTEADPTNGGGCLGGTLDPTRGGPSGCFCIGQTGNCFAGQYIAFPVSPGDCTAAAVAACCAAGACHTVMP